MNPAERDRDIIERILEDHATILWRMERFDLDKDAFCNDRTQEGELAFDSIMNPLYRIVEDAIHLSDAVTRSLDEVPWKEIRGFRNFVAHGYSSINRAMAWEVVSVDLPALVDGLREYSRDDLCSEL